MTRPSLSVDVKICVESHQLENSQGETRGNTYTIDVIFELLDGFVPDGGRLVEEERVIDVTSTDGPRS